jgi:hypothetical protein
MSFDIRNTDHDDRNEDSREHCDCDKSVDHCVALVLLLSCMLPIITYYRQLSTLNVRYSGIMLEYFSIFMKIVISN